MQKGSSLEQYRRRRKCLHRWKYAHELSAEQQRAILHKHKKFLLNLKAFELTKWALRFNGELDNRYIEITADDALVMEW